MLREERMIDVEKFAMYGKLVAHPGQRDALAQLLLDAAEQLKADDNCLLYLVNVSEDEPDAVWVTELWTSKEAHAAALDNEETKEAIRRGREFIAGVEPVRLRLVGGKGP